MIFMMIFMMTFMMLNSDKKVSHSNTDFNLMWTGSHPKPHSFKSLLPHQVGHHVDSHGAG